MVAPTVSRGSNNPPDGSRVCGESGRSLLLMKAKAAAASFPTSATRAARTKPSLPAADSGNALARPQPFLVQALRLRSRKADRR